MATVPQTRKGAFKPLKLSDKKKTAKMKKIILDGLEDGLDVREAFLLAGIEYQTFSYWKKRFVEDMQHDYPPTPFLKFMWDIAKADVEFHRSIRKELVKKAKDGDIRALIYLEDNRFGMANKRKQVLDIGTKEDTNIEINIVNMTSVDNDEDAIEVDFDEVEHRDDSDSTEMD